MKKTPNPPEPLEKISTGIEGFDDITGGGLPRRRTMLLMGGPGCGKTVLALQILVNGAIQQGAPGIFIAFEEGVPRVLANAETFGWRIRDMEKRQLYFVDACISSDVVKAGAFDLAGLLSALEAKAREMGAKLIVFDAIDVLLSLLDDPAAECRELYRLHEWLLRNELTGILTTKVGENKPAQRYGFMPFMADCAVLMSQRVTDRVAVRSMRVVKYRGSAHVLNEVPFVIGPEGVEVGSSNGAHPESQPLKERVSTGVERLDAMLEGGFFRGANALITGSSGTGKSTLAGAFIEAACRRGERSLFLFFNENAPDIVRDLESVGIDLASHAASGLLRMESVRSDAACSEEHFMKIKRAIRAHEPRCVAIDPLSALARCGGGLAAGAVVERLIYFCRKAGITVLFTSLTEGTDQRLETTPLYLSTTADSWIEISYSLHAGERNRALSIIKSRGSKHSSQQRELIFDRAGITLADPYTAGGEVLMGALRLEKESAMRAEADHKRREIERTRRDVELIIAERDRHLEAAQCDLRNRSEELEMLQRAETAGSAASARRQDAVRGSGRKPLRKRPAPGKSAMPKQDRRGSKMKGAGK